MFFSTAIARGAALLAGVVLTAAPLSAQTPLTWTNATVVGDYNSGSLSNIAVDAAGNVYETRTFLGSAQIGNQTLVSTTSSDALLAKYSPAGVLLWVRQLSSAGPDSGFDVEVDAAGNCYVAGYFAGPITLGNGVELTSTTTSTKAYVVSYAPDGTVRWAQQSSATGASGTAVLGNSLAVDAAGAVYLAGRFQQQARFGNTILNAPAESSGEAAFVAKFAAANGALLLAIPAYYYARPAPNASALYQAPQLAVSPAGDITLATYFSGRPVFGPVTLTSQGRNDVLLARYSATGTLQWVQQFGGPQDELVSQVKTDAAGNTYLAGSYEGSPSFGTTPLPAAAVPNAFLAKYSAVGQPDWVQPGSSASLSRWMDLALDATGAPYVTGYFSGETRYGTTPPVVLTSAGGTDAVVAAYTPQGQALWAQAGAGTYVDMGTTLGLDAQGSVYVAGFFTTAATFGPVRLSLPSTANNRFLARLSTTTLARQEARTQALGLYPNPATSVLQVPALPAGTAVQFVDARGRVARHATVGSGAQVSVRGLAPGLYILRTSTAQGQQFAGRVVVE
ncbi:T9SS type A sorting domain-containing protein [Hymenobacter cellulosivorans]|uniref:T9SS type A sorting domain-containing protein n=1 Tax=Hymenobacter cellulosivorans TaxID=2932249 RepID=A0ABY4F6M8_9BACT|nr:T9SS type A sorting domain-containing protein [Hymenobacter cellulosivorans]UOQ52230.1 T9SS type A sorting domain-containing protein [Hymenobacter cellulosivorans]